MSEYLFFFCIWFSTNKYSTTFLQSKPSYILLISEAVYWESQVQWTSDSLVVYLICLVTITSVQYISHTWYDGRNSVVSECNVKQDMEFFKPIVKWVNVAVMDVEEGGTVIEGVIDLMACEMKLWLLQTDRDRANWASARPSPLLSGCLLAGRNRLSLRLHCFLTVRKILL